MPNKIHPRPRQDRWTAHGPVTDVLFDVECVVIDVEGVWDGYNPHSLQVRLSKVEGWTAEVIPYVVNGTKASAVRASTVVNAPSATLAVSALLDAYEATGLNWIGLAVDELHVRR